VRLALALAVSSIVAAMRLRERFRHYSGLGLLRSGYSWLFVGFVGLLSAVSYMGLAEVETVLTTALRSLHPGFMDALKIGGAGGGGHALVGIAGRLAPRPRPSPHAPAESSGWQELVTLNAVLAFFYNGIYDHITERMHLEARSLARRFDWKTVRECTCTLLEDEMTVARLPEEEGQKLVKKIRALPQPSNPEEDLSNKYLALSWTIGKCSYAQLESRLRQQEAGRTP